MVIDKPALAALLAPLAVAMAVIECGPSDRTDVVIEYAPAVATPLPTTTPSDRIDTVAPASAVPLKVGVLTLVMLSVLLVPASLELVMSGVEGTFGAPPALTVRIAVELVTDWPSGLV